MKTPSPLLALLLALALPVSGRAADVPVSEDTGTLPSGTVTTGSGKSKSLVVQSGRDALLRFDLASLPAGYDAETLQSARLRIFVTKVAKPGDLAVYAATEAWSESADGPAPALSPVPFTAVTSTAYRSRSFLVVDVTETAREWLADPSSNFGIAVVADGSEPTTKLSFAAKEGAAGGPAAELEIEAAVPPGTNNTGVSSTNVIAGGADNAIDPLTDWAVIPGGSANAVGPDADYSIAAGRRAHANHAGSFVWADSTNADFSSTVANQFSIRAQNGFFIANDAGGATGHPAGTYFRDNSIVAWARVTAAGGLDTNYNVASITKVGTGHYRINLNTALTSGFSLIPAVTPEVDDNAGVPPVGAANVRIVAANMFAAGTTFDVFIYNGSFASVDNDFHFVLTGR